MKGGTGKLALAALGLTFALVATANAGVEWSPVTGEVTARYMLYNEDSPREDSDHFGEGFLRVEINGQLTKKLRLVATPLLQYDDADRTDDTVEFHENQLQRPAGTFQELYLSYASGKFELTVGKQIFAWGPSPLYRPTDNLNAADFLDVPTLHKIGVPAISLSHYGSSADVQVVIAPLFTPHRLPQANNRWTILPEDILQQIKDVVGFEPPIVLRRDLPEDEVANMQTGIRVRSSSWVDGWDLEFSAFHGEDAFGLFDAALLFPPVRIEATQVYPQYNEVGGGFSTAAGKLTFHTEVTYHRTAGSIDDDYWQYVGGFDVNFDSGIPSALDRITLGLEYAGESIDNLNTRPRSTFETGFDRVLVNSAIAGADFVFSEETSVRLAGTINFNDDDYAWRVELTHELIENLKLRAGVDVLNGPQGTYYGTWDENDRAYVYTSYFF